MNILLYDLEISKNDIYDIISKHLGINFLKVNNKDDFFLFYEKHDKDSLIIIDVSYNEGEEIFNHITKLNQKRKILVLSKILTYNYNFTCAQCIEQFNRKLLLKPLNIGQLIAYINNFDTLVCKFSSESNKIIEIMHDILKQFVYYSYNEKEKKIIKKENHTNNLHELIRITELLNTHKISYEIEDENIKLQF